MCKTTFFLPLYFIYVRIIRGDFMHSVIFDMDGTLLDTQRISIPAWEYVGSLQGISGMGEHVKKIFGMNERGSTEYLVNNFPSLNVPLFKNDYREYIKKHGTVKFMTGAQILMSFLKEKGVKVALASGTRKATVLSHLKKLSCENYFDAIIGGDEVENGKPSPDIFLKAASLIGAKADECFVFEDSPNGVHSAYNAGMKCIGIPDVVEFNDEIKGLLFAELNNLGEAIDLLNKYL